MLWPGVYKGKQVGAMKARITQPYKYLFSALKTDKWKALLDDSDEKNIYKIHTERNDNTLMITIITEYGNANCNMEFNVFAV